MSRRVLAATVGVTALAAVALAAVDIDSIRPKRWREVVPGRLYRSGQLHQALVESVLKRHNIRLIIDFTERREGDAAQEAELAAAARLGIRHVRLPLDGWGTGRIEHYASALTAMRTAVLSGEPCLVHCAAGSERTGAAVAFYRILFEGVEPWRAVQEMRSCGMRPHRNRKLLPYMEAALERLPDLLAAGGVPAMARPELVGRLQLVAKTASDRHSLAIP